MRAAATIRHRALGVAFLVLLAASGWLTYAVFNEQFKSFDYVKMDASRIGLQLPHAADIKIHGVIVGEVHGAVVTRHGAQLTLGLYPQDRHLIPSNVSARIVPKTLFGEKYVALQMPKSPSSRSIQSGDVITESKVSIEVEKVLSDIYPLLRTVQPAQLNYTLTAFANALDGRGEKIGRNMVVLDNYLKRTNPQIPLFVDDLHKLGSVSDTYRQVVPELSNFLRNSVTTGHTFVQKDQEVRALFDDVASFSSTSRDFLEQNGQNIIRLSKQGQQQLPLYAKYSPEYPCLLKGIVDVIPREEQAFRGKTLHINLETLKKQPRGYNTGDNPAYADHRGPVNLRQCAATISGKFSQQHLFPKSWVPKIRDGVNYPLGKGRAAPTIDMSSGYAGTGAERTVVDGLAGPVLGVPRSQVPDVASLLFGPLARGSEVSVR